MANEMNITISLTDKISAQLESASASLEKFSTAAKHIGRELSQVGSTISMLGGAISGPFVLALANSAKSSAAVSEQMNRLHAITNQFQTTIAESVVPIVEKFNNILNGLLTAFNSLDPGMRTMILQGAFLAGIFLAMGGIMTFVIGKTLALAANVAGLASTFLKFAKANIPLLAIAASIGILIFLMFKFKGVADTVVSTFEVLFKLLENGFRTVNAVFEGTIAVILEGLAKVTELLGKIPGPTQKAFQGMTKEIEAAADVARRMADNDLKAIADNAEAIGEIFKTGQGEWSQTFDQWKISIEKNVEVFKQGNVEILEDASRLQQELQKQRDELKSLKEQNANEDFLKNKARLESEITLEKSKQQESMNLYATVSKTAQQANKAIETSFRELVETVAKTNKDAARVLQVVSIGEAIMTTAAGVARALKDYPFPQSLVIGALVAAKGAAQIAIIAGQKFHSGGVVGSSSIRGDEVPIIAQTGEGILSRKGMISLGGEPVLNALNRGQTISNTQIGISIYIQSANLSSGQDITMVGEELGIRTARSLKTARGI